MKLKKEFITSVSGNQRIIAGEEGGAFSGMIRNDETAAFIVDRLARDTMPETIIAEMYAECDAPIGVIVADVERVLNLLRGVGALEE